MRNILILIGILLAGMVSAANAQFMDVPHNASNSMVCNDCHTKFTIGSYTDAVCESCHNNDTGGGYSLNSAMQVKTHSAANTSPTYGTWSKTCIDCHFRQTRGTHGQLQTILNTTQTYLVTGTITTPATTNPDGSRTYGYNPATLVVNNPAWSDTAKWGKKSANASNGNERGLIFYKTPITIDGSSSVVGAEIISATANTITVTGNPGAISAGNTFALVYGQFIRTSIVGAGGQNKAVKFFTNTGQNSFAYDESATGTDPTPNGVCQVCHTQTQHWKADGTLAGVGVHAGQNGANCVVCHRHEAGFKAEGCNSCHGFPPINNSLGGPDGLVVNEGGTGSASPGAHAKHATPSGLNYSCDTCHSGGMPVSPIYDKIIQLGFNVLNAGGVYDGRSSLANGYAYSANVTTGGSQSCTNLYCHSNAKIGTPVQQYAVPVWSGAPQTCSSCHGYPPQYENGGAGTATANSHVPHVANNDFGCELCHNTTTSDGTTITGPAMHVNGAINVAFDATNPGGVYSAATKTCSTIACHGAGAPQWGGTVRCQDCHLSTADLDDFSGVFYDNGTTATIKNAGEWDTSGHGKVSGSYTSGNPAAGFTVSDACLYCHDDTIAHKTATNPFRLKNFTDAEWGKNGNCQSCHAAGASGVTVNGQLRNGSKKIASTHYGTKHTAGGGGQFCWDCHDPHGDSNIFMVHASVAKTSDVTTGAPAATVATIFTAFSTGTDYAKSSAPFDGICNVCHTITNHYTATSGDHHNEGVRCTDCHQHSVDTKTDAFRPSGCDTCHGNPPITNSTIPTPTGVPNYGLVNTPAPTGSTSAGVHATHATSGSGAYGYSCEKCHAGGMPASPIPNMLIEIGFNISAAYQTGSYDGRTLPLPNGYSYIAGNIGTAITNTGTQRCNNLYCHSNAKVGTAVQTFANPIWTNGPLTCVACHGFPPSYSNGGAGASTANSHLIHVINNGFGCEVCHSKTALDGGSKLDVAFHANTNIDVNFDSSNPSGTYNPATKTCSSTTCHGTGTPQWGASLSADCTACHGGNATSSAPIALPNHPEHMNNAAVLGTNFECAQCHNETVSPGNDRLVTGTVHANGTKNVSFQLGGTFVNNQCSSTYCHSSGKGTYVNPPVWGSTTDLGCNGCHGTGNTLGMPDYANAGAGLPSANSHAKHAATVADCGTCHTNTTATGMAIRSGSVLHINQSINVTFDAAKAGAGATYTPGTKTCSNVSCHATGTPQWGASLSADCTACHGGNAASATPIALPNHPDHMNNSAILGTNYECAQCHNTTVSPGNDRVITGTVHVNGTKDVAFQLGGTWTAGSMSCSNVYCHSSGKGTYVNPPAWGSATNLGCNSCHGTSTATGAPDYANAGAGQPNANSHAKHVGAGLSSCDTCHTGTVAASGTAIEIGSMLHTNQTLDVTFNTAMAGAGATWTAATKTCSNIACHGTGAPQWGATSIACQSCHLGAADIDDFAGTFYNNGTASAIKNAGEWDTTGHGRAAGNYASGNAAAGFTTPSACLFCHDDAIAHNTASNPFRLRNIDDATWGKNGVCQNCHETGSAGITVDGVNKNGTKKIGSTHYGAKHTAAGNGGQFCWDCHDPHGDNNVFMVHKSVAKISDPSTGAPTVTVDPLFTAFATGTDYAKSAAPFNGICNVCHTSTAHYTSTGGDGHNSGTRCTQCHKHTGDTMTDAFKPSGTCIGCHSVPLGDRRNVMQDFTLTSHHIKGTSIAEESCIACHGDLVTDRGHSGTATPDPISELRNPDTGAYFTVNGATGSDLEAFCANCHDANGAVRLGANAMKPFIDSDDMTRPVDIRWTVGAMSHSAFNACFNCHGNAGAAGNTLDPIGNAHGSTSPFLLAGTIAGEKVSNTQEALCFACHDGSPASTNIEGMFAGSATGISRSGARINSHHDVSNSDQAYSGAVIECKDCHNPHHVTPSAKVIADPDPGDGRIPAPGKTWSESTFVSEFCLDCHDNSYPPSVKPPTVPLTDIRDRWVPTGGGNERGGDQHGPRNGSSNISLRKGSGYSRGDILQCTDCHNAGHGGVVGGKVYPNMFNLKPVIYSKDGKTPLRPDWSIRDANPNLVRVTNISANNTDPTTNGKAFCSTCHPNPMGGTKNSGCMTKNCHGHGASSF